MTVWLREPPQVDRHEETSGGYTVTVAGDGLTSDRKATSTYRMLIALGSSMTQLAPVSQSTRCDLLLGEISIRVGVEDTTLSDGIAFGVIIRFRELETCDVSRSRLRPRIWRDLRNG